MRSVCNVSCERSVCATCIPGSQQLLLFSFYRFSNQDFWNHLPSLHRGLPLFTTLPECFSTQPPASWVDDKLRSYRRGQPRWPGNSSSYKIAKHTLTCGNSSPKSKPCKMERASSSFSCAHHFRLLFFFGGGGGRDTRENCFFSFSLKQRKPVITPHRHMTTLIQPSPLSSSEKNSLLFESNSQEINSASYNIRLSEITFSRKVVKIRKQFFSETLNTPA